MRPSAGCSPATESRRSRAGAGRSLPRRIAQVLAPLGAQRRLEHSAGELAHQPARSGDLLRPQCLQRVQQRVVGQQAREPSPNVLNRTLRTRGPRRYPSASILIFCLVTGGLSRPKGRVAHPDLTQNIGQNLPGRRDRRARRSRPAAAAALRPSARSKRATWRRSSSASVRSVLPCRRSAPAAKNCSRHLRSRVSAMSCSRHSSAIVKACASRHPHDCGRGPGQLLDPQPAHLTRGCRPSHPPRTISPTGHMV